MKYYSLCFLIGCSLAVGQGKGPIQAETAAAQSTQAIQAQGSVAKPAAAKSPLPIKSETLEKHRVFMKRTCPLFRTAAPDAQVVCIPKEGIGISTVGKLRNGFAFVVVNGTCEGFVSTLCIGGSGAPKQARGVRTPRRQTVRKTEIREEPVIVPTLGVRAFMGGLRAGVPYADEKSTGLGWDIGVFGGVLIHQKIRVNLGVSYQSLKLERTIDTSGGAGLVQDSSPNQVTTVNQYIALSLMGSYRLTRYVAARKKDVQVWFDAGGEYLYWLARTQTDSTNPSPRRIAVRDNLFLLVGGPSLFLQMAEGVHIGLHIQFSYNVAAEANSSLFGLRGGLALQSTL